MIYEKETEIVECILHVICLGYLAGTATHSTSELSWSMVTGEKLKAPSLLSTTTCVLLNGCPHFAQ